MIWAITRVSTPKVERPRKHHPTEATFERIPESEWRWFGDAGHFICSDHCRFHLSTKVGDWFVSTVGKLVPDSEVQIIQARVRGISLNRRGDAREAEYLEKLGYDKLGYWGTYETMVFHWTKPCDDKDCGGMAHVGGSSVQSERYDDAKSATEGHYRYCGIAARGEIKDRGEG